MYATAFDKGYLLRGVAMIQSLLQHQKDAIVAVLCLDLETEIAISDCFDKRNLVVLRSEDVGHDLMISIRKDREYREFCWTLGAVLCNHILEKYDCEVVYLDADIFFYSDPIPILEEARKGDLAAIRHRFPPRLAEYEVNGLFNVQWVYFANSEIGRMACKKWAGQCIDCCSYLPEKGIVGDQKYLDEWPSLYPTFIDIQNTGAGVAPWNHEIYKPTKIDNSWYVRDGESLIFYHFHGLKIDENGKVSCSGSIYSEIYPLSQVLYSEYLEVLRNLAFRFSKLVNSAPPASWKIRTKCVQNRNVVGSILRFIRTWNR